MLTWPSKDPAEVLDYEIDWTNRFLDPVTGVATGETISTSTWSVPTGSVVIASSPVPSISGNFTKLWLTGGTAGDACVLLNQIVTSAGRIFDQRVRLRIRSH
jgi:hypothetical protein